MTINGSALDSIPGDTTYLCWRSGMSIAFLAAPSSAKPQYLLCTSGVWGWEAVVWGTWGGAGVWGGVGARRPASLRLGLQASTFQPASQPAAAAPATPNKST